jgi:hypothetical protein
VDPHSPLVYRTGEPGEGCEDAPRYRPIPGYREGAGRAGRQPDHVPADV